MSQELLGKILDFTSETIIRQNLAKLYALLYPYIAADFRHKEDCLTAMNIVDAHPHLYTDQVLTVTTVKPTNPPTVPSAVNDTIGLSLIGVDSQYTTLPAKITASIVIKPFEVT